MVHALFPGTFDPPTNGHLDVARRSAALFERVTIGLADHPEKRTLFTVEERVALWETLVAPFDNVAVRRVEGLVVEAARALSATVLVRGVRNPRDFDYEVEMARTNRVLAGDVDTVLIVPDAATSHITSTLVRQIAGLGGDVSQLVPPAVVRALTESRG